MHAPSRCATSSATAQWDSASKCCDIPSPLRLVDSSSMSVPSMVHRSGDTLIVRSVVSGDTLFGSPEDTDFGDELSEITDDKDLPECKIKRNYSCARCDYFTQNPRHFLYHLRDVHKEKVRIYECPNCLYASKHFQKLLRHTKMVHGSTEGVDMPEYARAKGKKRSLPEDEEEGGEEEQEAAEDSDECEVEAASVFKCSLCAFSARNQAQLAKHEREEHIKTKFFRCSKCTYVTHMKARFTKHVKYHSMPMIKCDLCDFRTPYKWNLDRHCKNHNGRGTFRCSACNFTADIKQSLTVHEMNHHVPPVGQAAGLGVGRRRNKVGASDSTAAEEAAQVAAAAAAQNDESEQSAPPPPPSADDSDKKPPSQKQLKIPSVAKKSSSKSSEHNGGTRAYASDFIHPDDIIHHANGNIYIKNKCKLCNYKSAWDGEMAKHEEKVHNILRPPAFNAKPKKPTRPVPNLIPIPPQTSVLKIIASPRAPKMSAASSPPTHNNAEPIMSQKDINEICAKSSNSSLKDFASLFNSEDVFKTPPSEPPQKIPDLLLPSTPKIRTRTSTTELLKQKNASFFDKLKAKLTSTNNLTCQHCGHESKCLTESTTHQKICGKERSATPVFAPVHSISSTRCQYCRQRCKSSIDLLNHLQTCLEAVRSLESEATAQVEIIPEEAQPDPEPHPMENRVFVWNNIEVPMDIEIDESPYEYVEEKQEDNVSLDLSVRTQSPCSENSYVNPEIQPHNSTEKIPTHGNDISVAQHKRVFKCPHCSFWASTASRFHVHIVGHLNKKPFECSLCSYRSNWRWDITKHIKLKSVRDPAHETAKVLMTDETGRRNYTKYNKYLTEINVGGDHNETSGGSGTRPKLHDSPSQVLPSSKTELPKLTRAPNSSDFSPLLKNSLRPPPALKAADDSLFLAKVTAEKKRPNADNKKTLWQCKKCNFRDASRDKLLLHVKGHYLQVEGGPAASGGDQGELLSGNPELDERHCRLKHHGDIRVVVGTKNGPEKVEVDEQLDEPDHVDLPQTGTFKCKQCPFSNNNNDEFEQHLEGHSQKAGALTKCHLCNFHVAHQDELHAHLKLHGIIEPEDYLAKRDKNEAEITKRYKCVTCPYVTNSKSQYSYHKQFHKPRGGQYTCPTCGYNVSKRHLLHQHLKVHGISTASQKQNGDVIDLDEISDEIEEVVTTQGASSSLESQSFPDIPLVWVSKNAKFSKMYKCRYCPHVNLRKVNIQEHEKMHGVREKNPNASRLSEIEHRCPDCNYVCNNAGVLSSHSKVHQGMYGRIHCLVDPSKSDEDQVKELTHFLSLQASPPSVDAGHLEDDEQMETDYLDEQADNSGEIILYFCDKCPARFLKENEFSIHLRFHGVRLFYKCEHCTYTARQKPHLLAHSNVHTDDYQDRTKTLKTLYCTHPTHPQPTVYVSANQNGEAIWVVDETNKPSYAGAATEMENEPPVVVVVNKVVVPLSGTDLFLQRNEANQKHLSNPTQQFGGGNPDFIYPTCLKNGRMKEKRYKCLKCPSAFEKREQYKVHLSLHGSKQKYTCEICDYSVKYFANYAQHIKKHQMNAQAQAARNFDEPEDELDAPAEAPSPPKPEETTSKDPPEDKKQLFWCPSCPYTNHRRDAVDNHQKRHISVSGTSSNYTCEHCDYSVPQIHFLRDHTKWHFAPINKSIQPEAYMVCDRMKLTSRKVEDGADQRVDVKMEVDVDDDNDNSPESLIFEDRGGEAEENRFEPPLHSDILQHLVDSEDEKLFVNPETGEVVNKDFKTTPAQASSTTDSSDISAEENLDSQVASDN